MSKQAAVNPSASYTTANGQVSPPQSNAEEINPLASIAGSYATDPFWEEFVQLMEESHQAIDRVTGEAE